MDLLVAPTKLIGEKIIRCFLKLNLEIGDLKPEDFENPLVLSFGLDPDGVYIINQLKSSKFSTLIQRSQFFKLDEVFHIPVIDAWDLLNEKQQLNRSGRKGLTDQIDILSLKKFLEKKSDS